MSGEVRFIIDKEHGVVVCKLTGCKDIAVSRLDKYMPNYDYYLMGSPYWLNTDIKDTYTGIARCNPEDEWDEEYGKKLALLRAKQKRGKAINNVLIKVVHQMAREMEDLWIHGIHDIPEEM